MEQDAVDDCNVERGIGILCRGKKGACKGLGAATLLNYVGASGVSFRMHLDVTAAKGIIESRLNKVRHIETDVLWLQEQ